MLTKKEFLKRYEQVYDLLFGFAMKLTRNQEEAKDLVQESVCKAYKSKERFKKGTNFKAWLTTILRNTYINYYRRKRTRNQIEAPIEELLYIVENKSKGRSPDSHILMKELKELVKDLSDAYRVPFVLFIKGYQYHEIAEQLQIPIGTVKSRIYSARKNLQKMIGDNYGTLLRA